jgi:hypothetical protein
MCESRKETWKNVQGIEIQYYECSNQTKTSVIVKAKYLVKGEALRRGSSILPQAL